MRIVIHTYNTGFHIFHSRKSPSADENLKNVADNNSENFHISV